MKRWHFDNCMGLKEFQARVTHNGERIFLGRYATKEEAERVENEYYENLGLKRIGCHVMPIDQFLPACEKSAARVTINGKRIFIGAFNTPQEASIAEEAYYMVHGLSRPRQKKAIVCDAVVA
jgi:hypothetical protein